MKKQRAIPILFFCILYLALTGCGLPTEVTNTAPQTATASPLPTNVPRQISWTWGGIYCHTSDPWTICADQPEHPIAQNNLSANQQLMHLTNNYFQITYVQYDTLGHNGGHGMNLVKEGVFPMWETVPMYLTLYSPEIDLYHLIGLCQSFDHSNSIFNATRELRNQIYKENHGITIKPNYGSFPYPLHAVFTKKPLTDLQSLMTMRIRHHTALGTNQLSGIGIEAQHISWDDTYQSLESGHVDAAVTSISAAISSNLIQITPYFTILPACGGYAEPVFNIDALFSLPEDVLTTFEEVGQQLSETNANFWDNTSKSDDHTASSEILSFQPIPKEMGSELTILLEPGIEEWANKIGSEALKFLSHAKEVQIH